MDRSLRLLIVEDVEDDALLLAGRLEREGYKPAWERVETIEEMSAALDHKEWDIIISDHSMPQFNALDALDLVKQKNIDAPFIIVSGVMSEDLAAEAMKAGANDYIQKGNLARLAPAIKRELNEVKLRRVQNHTQKLLIETEERYRTLLGNSPMRTIVVDGKGRITALNYAERISNERQPEIGQRMYVDFASKHKNDMRAELMNCIATGKPKEFPQQVYKDRVLSIRIAPFRTGAIITSEDVTEHYRANIAGNQGEEHLEKERGELQDALERVKRMESMGTLVGGVAHNLNNILVPLLAYPDLLELELEQDDRLVNYIRKIKESAESASDIVQDLLTLGRRGRYEKEDLNLNFIVESYLRSSEFEELISNCPDVTLEVVLGRDLSDVFCSPAYMSKVVRNLIGRALCAMPDGGALKVTTSCKRLDHPIEGYEQIDPGEYVTLTVSDTGTHLDKIDYKKIFEPFYLKKETGHLGSGLEMTIIHDVVKDHNGYVDLYMKADSLAEFVIYLPVNRDIPAKTESGQVSDCRGCEKILIVDDIEEQRQVASGILSSMGYEVEVAENGREAIEYLKDNYVDIILLDMIMEDDFDGLDTYRQIVEMCPEQKVIIVSGFSETSRVREAQKLGAGQYFRKPYTLQNISKAVRQELDRE